MPFTASTRRTSTRDAEGYARPAADARVLAQSGAADAVDLIDKTHCALIRHPAHDLAERSLKRKVATMKSLFHSWNGGRDPGQPVRKMDVRIREARRLPRTVRSPDRPVFRHVYAARDDAAAGTARRAALVRDLAVLEALFATGARVAEVCSLTADDIDLERGRIRILGKGSRERIVQLCHPEAIAALKEYRAQAQGHGSGWFFANRFGGRLSEQSVRVILRRHTEAAGLALHVTRTCPALLAAAHETAPT